MDYLREELFLPELLTGAAWTAALTILSMPLAVFFGLLLALMRTSKHTYLVAPAAVYIEIVRGTPLLVQIHLVFFTLPPLGRFLHEHLAAGWPWLAEQLGPNFLTWPGFLVGVICLAGNYAAYEAEIHRAGLQAVDKGQREAALSLGLSERQAFWSIVLPQSLRVVVPPIFNDLIAMLKDTSLVMTVQIPELMYTATRIGRSQFTVPKMMFTAAVIYLILSLLCYLLGKAVERWLSFKGAPAIGMDKGHH